MERHAEAIECLDKAIELDPKYQLVWANKGRVLRAMGRHAEAIECFDKVIEIYPGYNSAWNNKGNALKVFESSNVIGRINARLRQLLRVERCLERPGKGLFESLQLNRLDGRAIQGFNFFIPERYFH